MKTTFVMRTIVMTSVLFTTTGRFSTAIEYRAIMLSGQPAPGFPVGQVFGENLSYVNFSATINKSGEVAFQNALDVSGQGGLGSDVPTIWTGGNHPLNLVARIDVPPPAPTTGNVSLFNGPFFIRYTSTSYPKNVRDTDISDDGTIVFGGTYDIDATHYEDAIWTAGSNHPWSVIAHTHQQAPGAAAGVYFDGFYAPFISKSGRVAFAADLEGPGVVYDTNHLGIWSQDGSSLKLLARTGAQAPGLSAGSNFTWFTSSRSGYFTNSGGPLSFSAEFKRSDASNGAGIWAERTPGNLELVVQTGQPAPTAAGGLLFDSFGESTTGPLGHTAFAAGVNSSGVYDFHPDNTLWVEDGHGGLRLVASQGQLAIGGSIPWTFAGFETPAVDAAGHVASRAVLVNGGFLSNTDSVWYERPDGAYKMLAMAGAHAPGLPTDATFQQHDWQAFSDPVMDSSGQVAFMAYWYDGQNSGSGIWATDASGHLQRIASTRQTIDIDPDPAIVNLKTIGSLTMQNDNHDFFQPLSLSDRGEIAFVARFTDGTNGVLIATIPVPECQPLAIAAILGAVTLLKRTSRTKTARD